MSEINKEKSFKHINTIILNDYYTKKSFEVLVCEELYSEELLQKYPKYLFVFGDNSKRVGLGGQAVIRNCENVFGFITKIYPSNKKEAFLSDEMFDKYKNYVDKTIEFLKYVFEKNDKWDTLVFPYTGLGNGLAKMPEKAPKCYEYLKKSLKRRI